MADHQKHYLSVDFSRPDCPEVAEGNLCVEIKVDSQDQLGQLMQALRDMCGSLSNTVREVRQERTILR